MFSPDQYQLLDFGDGRKLERFGAYVLNRPSPGAEGFERRAPKMWSMADAAFITELDDAGFSQSRNREPGHRIPSRAGRGSAIARAEVTTLDPPWESRSLMPKAWTITHTPFSLQLRCTPFGHVGVFPEQAENWDWIAERAAGLKVLNLFAYTGGSTLAAARAGAEVTHIDAARNVVAWARSNAELSGLAEAPIRWIAEDVRKFVARELRRGNRYDAVILDPPSYGHGPKGEAWKIEEHLSPLLNDCLRLTNERPAFVVLTCHTPGYAPAALVSLLTQSGVARSPGEITAHELLLVTPEGRSLSSGAVARWPS